MKIYSFLTLALFALSGQLNAQELSKDEAKAAFMAVSRDLQHEASEYRKRSYYALPVSVLVVGLASTLAARNNGAELSEAFMVGGVFGGLIGGYLGICAAVYCLLHGLMCDAHAKETSEAAEQL